MSDNTECKGNEKLVRLLDAIGDLSLGAREIDSEGSFFSSSISLLDDACNFLVQMYVSTAGKLVGKYYSPRVVAKLLAGNILIGKDETCKICNFACSHHWLTLREFA